MTRLDARPVLFIVSGPSGAGKGTALSFLAEEFGLKRLTTYTTRPRRPEEEDGRDYIFVSEEQFFEKVRQGIIYEYTRTYRHDLYGSPAELIRDTSSSDHAIVELDPLRFFRIRAVSRRRVVGIFVAPPSYDVQEKRIMERYPEGDVFERMHISMQQLNSSWSYDYFVVNDSVEAFRQDLRAVVHAELLRASGARRLLASRTSLDPTLVVVDRTDRNGA